VTIELNYQFPLNSSPAVHWENNKGPTSF